MKKTNAKRLEGKSETSVRAIAAEEIVARACEDRLANSAVMKKFIDELENKESGLAQRFSNYLGEAIGRVSELFRNIVSRAKSSSKEARALARLADELKDVQSQFDALLEKRTRNQAITAENAQTQQKNTSDRGVMAMSRGESESIKNQIVKATPQLNQMDIVVSVTTEGFGNLRDDQIATIISNEFSKIGRKIDRKNFGVVQVEYKQINKALNYLDDPAEN